MKSILFLLLSLFIHQHFKAQVNQSNLSNEQRTNDYPKNMISTNPLTLLGVEAFSLYYERFILKNRLSVESNIKIYAAKDPPFFEVIEGIKYYPFTTSANRFYNNLYFFQGVGYTHHAFYINPKDTSNENFEYAPSYEQNGWFSQTTIGYRYFSPHAFHRTKKNGKKKTACFFFNIGLGINYYFKPFVDIFTKDPDKNYKNQKHNLMPFPAVQIGVGVAF